MTRPENVKKGEKFWCVYRKLTLPMHGTVIIMTDNPGKSVGVEFDEDVGGHTCDNRGKKGHCLWLRPENLYTEEEIGLLKDQSQNEKMHQEMRDGKEVDSLQ